MQIFFSVGDPSGDVHGANLIRALRARRPDVECVGYGGPLMQEAGCRLHTDLTALAVMGLVRVLVHLVKFANLLSQADRYFRRHRPDVVVLIDYPGFNWWIARRAKAHGIPVVYYVPPQVWAWSSYRVKKVRRFVDLVLCPLRFETDWFRKRGCRATFVGHPFFDEVRRQSVEQQFLAEMRDAPGPLVTILPGSRMQEVTYNLPWFLRAAAAVRREVPTARFAVAAFKARHADMAREMVAAAGLDVPVFVGRTPELIRAATCCLACSGSVSLELLHQAKPTVIGYCGHVLGNMFQHIVRNVPYITLVNLLSTGRVERDRRTERTSPPSADPRVLFPELYGHQDYSGEAAAHLVRWLTDEQALATTVSALEKLRDEVGQPGASDRAAEHVLQFVGEQNTRVPRPHYVPTAREATIRSAITSG